MFVHRTFAHENEPGGESRDNERVILGISGVVRQVYKRKGRRYGIRYIGIKGYAGDTDFSVISRNLLSLPNKRIALRRIKYLTAMTHIMIEDNTPEGKWLLELIRGHKSVTVMDEKKKKGFREAVAECNGRPAAEFFDEMSRQAKEHFDHA